MAAGDQQGVRETLRFWRGWLRRPHRTTTTAADAELVLVVLVVGLRLGVIVQMAPSLAHGYADSPRPILYLACWIAAAVTAIGISILVILRREPPGLVLTSGELALGFALLLLGPLVVLEEYRIGTWSGFQPGYALAVLLASSAVRSWTVWSGGLLGLLVGTGFFLLPLLESDRPVIVSNAVTYVIVAGVARIVVLHVRRVAYEADEARAVASQLAREDEVRRARVAFHNGVAVMRMLAEPHRDERSRVELQRQARSEANRMRAYLRGEHRAEAGEAAVPAAVASVCDRFPDLAIDLVVDHASGGDVDATDIAAIEHALVSVLLNVREHADAERVVVHVESQADTWTITVHDDGRGFVVRPDEFGVGLGEVVVGALRLRDIAVLVESDPGLGTMVTITNGEVLVPSSVRS